MPDNPKSNKEEKTGNGKRRKIYSFHEIKNKNNTDKLEHSSNSLLGTTSYDAKSSGTQGINLGRELVTVSSYPNSVFTQLSPINGNLHEAWFQSAQNSYFRYGLPSAPLPMTPVFAGIMNRRKRRENRPRRQRTTFTSEQTLKLELEYGRTEYISRPRRYELAEVLDLSENQIKIWFQNRRAKEKRIEKAQQDQQLRSSAMNNPTTYGSTGSYPVLCDPCVWPYPPGTLNNVLVTSSMS